MLIELNAAFSYQKALLLTIKCPLTHSRANGYCMDVSIPVDSEAPECKFGCNARMHV